jgi:hypothetical protein
MTKLLLRVIRRLGRGVCVYLQLGFKKGKAKTGSKGRREFFIFVLRKRKWSQEGRTEFGNWKQQV